MVAPVILAAAPSVASSATKDGGIINTLLKAAFIIAILAIIVIAYMWVSGNFSPAAIFDSFTDWYVAKFKENIMKYTPLGWAISGVSGVLSIFTGKIPKFKKFW